ncbi:MAG: hypothetical protein V1837_04085 [Candidatus Woesearchaeota archaeon]
MKKAIIISIMLLVMLVAGCKEKTLETGPETPCTTDNDCWCRSYTGLGFIAGKGPSRCCTEELQENMNQKICPAVNKCKRCLYQ